MKKIITLAFLLGLSTSVSASLIDFTSAPYISTFGSNMTTDTVDGVNFTITATAKGSDGFRQNADGLSFGVPGNGMYSLSIVSDTDLEYTSLVGKGNTLTDQLPFDLSVNGNLQLDNLLFVGTGFSTESLGNISVNAGDAFLIDVDYASFSGSNVLASAVIQSLGFNTISTAPPSATVPAPATLLLFSTGLLGLGFARKS